jgi:hypothetical protein
VQGVECSVYKIYGIDLEAGEVPFFVAFTALARSLPLATVNILEGSRPQPTRTGSLANRRTGNIAAPAILRIKSLSLFY